MMIYRTVKLLADLSKLLEEERTHFGVGEEWAPMLDTGSKIRIIIVYLMILKLSMRRRRWMMMIRAGFYEKIYHEGQLNSLSEEWSLIFQIA